MVLTRGKANTNAVVTVNSEFAQDRQGEHFAHQTSVANELGAVLQQITVIADDGTDTDTVTRDELVPDANSAYEYDADGNVTFDGYREFTWDAENRLLSVQPRSGLSPPEATEYKVEYAYDYLSRRIERKASQKIGNQWYTVQERRYLYDGWNVIAEISGDTSGQTLEQSYLRGLDLSNSPQGAGGVGGLLAIERHTGSQAGVHFTSHDGNGNVVALTDGSDGEQSASYEYDSFGNLLEMSGVFAAQNPYRFSTKRQDALTGLYDYGYRSYDPVAGRWLSRDPIAEDGGLNLYGFLGNDGVGDVDVLGAWSLKKAFSGLENLLLGPTPKYQSVVESFGDNGFAINTGGIDSLTGVAKKIYIVADENGQTRYYDASSKCWKKIGLDLVENALAADAKGLEQFIAAQNGPSLREQILKDAFLSGDPSIGDWLLYQFFDKLNGAGTLDLASAYYHHDIFSQQSLSDEAATLYALWGGVQLGAASTELVDLGALAKGLFRPSSSARFYDADYIVDLSGYAVAPRRPLALPAPTGYNPWTGSIKSVVAETDTVMYRVWGDEAGKVAGWLSPTKPTSSLKAMRELALPPGNSAAYVSEVLVPAGTRYQVGTAASAFGQPGGAGQVLLLDRIPAANFGSGAPLAPWVKP